jgi:hypothetical protein
MSPNVNLLTAFSELVNVFKTEKWLVKCNENKLEFYKKGYELDCYEIEYKYKKYFVNIPIKFNSNRYSTSMTTPEMVTDFIKEHFAIYSMSAL